MNRKISLGAAITFMLIAAAVTFCFTMVFSNDIFNQKVNSVKDRELMYEKIAEIDSIVRSKYYGEIDNDTLFNGLGQGYFLGLKDKYGKYMTENEYQGYIKEANGDAVGIGIIAVREVTGYIRILDVQDNSPAAASGLQKGDLIIQINGTKVTKDNNETLIKSLKDLPGTMVELVYRRNGEDSQPISIVRKQFDVKTVLSQMNGQTGYVKVTEFTEKTPSQFKIAVDELGAKGANGIVFDLRDNSEGTVDAVSQALDYLLPEGPIATAQYKDGTTTILTKSSAADRVNLPMTVVVNARTASAAELFAAVLKDYGKARLVGVTTAGKGVLQEVIKLKDGSAINLTVAKLNPPKSANYDGVGLTPDFIQTLTDEQAGSVYDLTFETDPQLKKAFEIIASQNNTIDQGSNIDSSGGQSTLEPEPTPDENEAPAA